MSKRILALCGSLRSVSMNAALLRADAQRREILTTISADLDAGACLALPLRGTGITEQGILASGHAADIRRALTLLTAGAPRE